MIHRRTACRGLALNPYPGGPTAHTPISGRVRPPRARMLPLRRHDYDK